MQHFRVLLVLVVFSLSSCNHSDNDSFGPPAEQPVEPLQSGLQTLMSGGVEREFFLALTGEAGMAGTASAGAGMSKVAAVGDGMSQVAAHDNDADRPLIFALHGYTGHYTNWVGETRVYDLIDVVGDHAVFVAPQALEDAAGNTIWGGQDDLDFFIDMLTQFSFRGLEYNRNKIFVVGHSNGAGFTHRLGCAHGDVFRAIVTAAGGLTDSNCVGSTAVMMFQGSNDELTSGNIAGASRDYWVKYNGWDLVAFVPAYEGLCDDYSFPDKPDNLPYPVLWCFHDQGHAFPTFGSETAWDFLTGLPEQEPSPDAPPGGGAERATPPSDALLTFQIDVPAEINRPLKGSADLRDLSFIDNPTCSAPDVILNLSYPVDGVLIPGELSEPITVPITYSFLFGAEEQFPSEWTLTITIYVEGGNPIGGPPAVGVDYNGRIPVSLVSRETDVIIDEVLTPFLVEDLCGFGG